MEFVVGIIILSHPMEQISKLHLLMLMQQIILKEFFMMLIRYFKISFKSKLIIFNKNLIINKVNY